MLSYFIEHEWILLAKENLVSNGLIVNGFQYTEFRGYRVGLVALSTQECFETAQQVGSNLLES